MAKVPEPYIDGPLIFPRGHISAMVTVDYATGAMTVREKIPTLDGDTLQLIERAKAYASAQAGGDVLPLLSVPARVNWFTAYRRYIQQNYTLDMVGIYALVGVDPATGAFDQARVGGGINYTLAVHFPGVGVKQTPFYQTAASLILSARGNRAPNVGPAGDGLRPGLPAMPIGRTAQVFSAEAIEAQHEIITVLNGYPIVPFSFSLPKEFDWNHTGLDWARNMAVWACIADMGLEAFANVPAMPVYPWLDGEGSDNGKRNAANFVIWEKNMLKMAAAIQSGATSVTFEEYMPIDLPAKNLQFYGKMLAVITIAVVAAYVAFPATMKDIAQKFVMKITRPIDVVTGIFKSGDIIGATTDLALDTVQQKIEAKILQVTGPLGKVYEIYTDPAGFVHNKIDNEILYVVKNPGDWLVDQGQKLMRNKLNGEIRDLITGALVDIPPASINATIPLSATVVETTPENATQPKKFPWRLVLLGASLLWGAA